MSETNIPRVRRVHDLKAGTSAFTVIGSGKTLDVDWTRLVPPVAIEHSCSECGHAFTSRVHTWDSLTPMAKSLLVLLGGNSKVGDAAAASKGDAARYSDMESVRDALYDGTASFGGGGGAPLDPVVRVLREMIAAELMSPALGIGWKAVAVTKAVTADARDAYNTVLTAQSVPVEDDESRDLLWTDIVERAAVEADRRSKVKSLDPNTVADRLRVLREAAAAKVEPEPEPTAKKTGKKKG